MKRMIVASAAMLLTATCLYTNSTFANSEDEVLTEAQEEALSNFSENLQGWLDRRASLEGSENSLMMSLMNPPTGGDVIITPDNPDNGFPGNPGDGPIPIPPTDGMPGDFGSPGGFDFPTFTRKSGAAEIIALESLYQTLMFYGVVHIIERKGTRKDFKIIQSKNGYFKNVTSLDVAFAIRTFSLYIQALLCNDPSQKNVRRMLGQVKWEEIGLRFKYDMAWALLGNLLPKEPNQIMKLGTRWKALSQLLSSIPTLSAQMGKEQSSELRSWASSITDVVNILSRLNKLMCFVDVRPDPREEIGKRTVVKALLELDKRTTERYSELKDLLDQVEKEGKRAQVDLIQSTSSSQQIP